MAKSTTPTQDGADRRTLSRPRLGGSGSGARPAVSEAVARGRRAPSLLSFFEESRAELRKVTWPTRQQTRDLTIAVIGMTIAVAVFLGMIDAGLDKLVSILLGTG